MSLILGSFLLTDGAPEALSISAMVIWPTVIVISGIMLFLVYKLAQAHIGKSKTGTGGLIGMIGEARADSQKGTVKVYVHSEIWTADTDDKIAEGDKVEVTEVNGLRLRVRKAGNSFKV